MPVFFDNVKPPLGFRSIHAANLAQWDGSTDAEAFRHLVNSIGRVIGTPKIQVQPLPPVDEAIAADRTNLKRAIAEAEANWLAEKDAAAAETQRLAAEQVNEQNRKNTKPPATLQKISKKLRPYAWLLLALALVLAGGWLFDLNINATVFQDTLKDGSLGPKMIWMPTGQFRMGDLTGKGEKDELPVHTVKISQSFAMGQYEVTFDDYDKFALATQRKLPDDRGWGRGKRPVINISWQDAVDYAQWLSAQTGKPYRLPTEAEWEFAARAGSETEYWWGNELGNNRANCDGCGSQWDNQQTAPVGSFPANAWGLYDTAGNVWEWAQDCNHDNYNGSPADGAAWQQGECADRVLRGGSWSHYGRDVRSASRGRFGPVNGYSRIGFRLALGQTGQ